MRSFRLFLLLLPPAPPAPPPVPHTTLFRSCRPGPATSSRHAAGRGPHAAPPSECEQAHRALHWRPIRCAARGLAERSEYTERPASSRSSCSPMRLPPRIGDCLEARAFLQVAPCARRVSRSEEHTSELQSRGQLVC